MPETPIHEDRYLQSGERDVDASSWLAWHGQSTSVTESLAEQAASDSKLGFGGVPALSAHAALHFWGWGFHRSRQFVR